MSYEPSPDRNEPTDRPIRVGLMIASMHGGGSEQQTLMLLRHLNRRRFEPVLLLTSKSGSLLDRVPGDVPVEWIHANPPPFYLPTWVSRRMATALSETYRRRRIDVIYDRTLTMTRLADAAMRMSRRDKRVPRVSTIVSPPDRAVPLLLGGRSRLIRRRLAAAYRRSAAVIAVSELAKQSAHRYYDLDPRSRPIEVIRNGVDRSYISALSLRDVEPSGGPSDFVVIGRMTREKGHADLIAALRLLETADQVPSLKVEFIGDGPLRSELQTSAASLRRHVVTFTGHSDNPMPYLRRAGGLILPSHFEGLPNVVLEAFALGVAVIATRSGGTVELDADNDAITWAEPHSPDSLAQAVRRFFAEPERTKVKVNAATRKVETTFDGLRTVQSIEAVLQRVHASVGH